MKIHELTQGSPEWLSYRRQHFNASDAPAMMGCSPYKTRTELLHEMATGLNAEVDQATQRRFDNGHRFEALARPLAEEIIGDELYPVVGSEGRYSASFDGLTMMQDTAFEHKTLSNELREVLDQHRHVSDLPKHYRVQMEQQCMVSGCERVLFMASKWDGETLIEERHCWYYPDSALRSEIVAGWAQFEADLAAYVPRAAEPVAVAEPVESLPAVSVRMDGQLVVASNLPDFGAALRAFIERIPAKPSTDQEFADAEAACKALKKAEEALENAETSALAQMADVEAMRRMVADLRNLARSTRLAREKDVAARKEQIRLEIVQEGQKALVDHVAALNARLGKPYMPTVAADFAGAIKGKRTVDSLRDASATELARAKIEASAIADRIQANLTTLRELARNHAFLFADTSAIVLKANDDLTALVKSRIAEHEAAEAKRLEAERERIRAEESAKLAREQAAREAAEARAERQRQQDERDAEDARRRAQQLEAEAAERERREPEYDLATAPPSHQTVTTPPTLRLGQINDRLGFTMTSDFLRSIGFDPAATDHRAMLYHEDDFQFICAALIAHIKTAQAKQAS